MKKYYLIKLMCLLYVVTLGAPRVSFAQNELLNISNEASAVNVLSDDDDHDLPIVFEMQNDVEIAFLEAQKIFFKDFAEIFQTKTGKKIATSSNVDKTISIYLKNIPYEDALKIVLDLNNLAYVQDGVVMRVMMPYEFESKYGQEFVPALKIENIKLSFNDGNYLAGVLSEMKSPKGTVFLNDRTKTILLRDTPENLDVMTAFIKEMDTPLSTEVFNLKQALPRPMIDQIQLMLTPNLGKMQFDERSNTITVTDKQSKIEEVEKFLNALGSEDRMIAIDAKIIQIVLNDEHPAGVDWEAIVTDYQSLAFKGFAYNDELNPSGNISVGYVTNEDFTILLDALDTVGVIYNVSNSSVNMGDLQRVPFSVQSLDMVILGQAQNQEDKSLQSTGVILNIRPVIDQNQQVSLEISPQKNDEAGAGVLVSDQKEGHNIFAQVEKDSTVVVGSLFKDIGVESSWKIPLLGDIPLLGFAFRNQGQTIRKTEIVIFLTPKIIQRIQP